MEIKRSYYAIIPANIRYDKRLKPGAKLLYGDFIARCSEGGTLLLDIEELSTANRVSDNTIYEWLHGLVNQGYVFVSGEKDIVSKLKKKNMKNLGFGGEVCEWCEVTTSVLHKHHHPVPKSKGGKEVVGICPNCHHEFHYHSKTIKLLLSNDEVSEILKIRSEVNGTFF